MTTRLDKSLAIILVFIAMMVLLASVIAMGAVPAIFQTKQETQNQTKIVIDYFEGQNKFMYDHFDQILTNQVTVIQKLNQSLQNQGIMLLKMNETIEQNKKDISLNLNISREHKQVARDHDMIMNDTGNTTKHIDDALFLYGENSVKQLQGILDNQEKLIEMHQLPSNNSNITTTTGKIVESLGNLGK